MSRCIGGTGVCGQPACGWCYPVLRGGFGSTDPMGTKPATLTPKPPAERAETDASTRALRPRAAYETLGAAGCAHMEIEPLDGIDGGCALSRTKDEVQDLRRRLLDGSNEPRLAACNVALEALGRLWCAP